MPSLLRFATRISQVPVLVASGALTILMVMTFCDVVLRSVWNAPIEAATELTRILLAVTVFSVLPIVSARGEHISVDLTDGLFDRLGIARLRDGLMQILCGVLLIWPLQRVWVLAERARDFGDVTEYLGIPQFYVGWFIAFAVACAILAMLFSGVITLIYGGAAAQARTQSGGREL